MATFDLVFEGGGAKGSVFVGALEVFFSAGHTAGRLVGTSAGAITAALLAAGYTPAEMLKAVTEQRNGKPRFAEFMDQPIPDEFGDEIRSACQLKKILENVNAPFIPDWLEKKIDDQLLTALLDHSSHFRQLFSFVECGGLFSGGAFVDWLNEKLRVKDVAAGCTLAEFHAQKGCDLSLVATDTTNREMMVLNHRTSPDVPVAMAVRMSMSIPFVWREVVWQKGWGLYRETEKTDSKIVDGGVLSNFPIDLIATSGDRVKPLMGEDADPAANLNLGMLIDEELPVNGVEGQPPRQNPVATVRRVQRLMNTMTGARDNVLIRDFGTEICRLPARGFGTTEFDMPQTKIDALVDAGRQAMRLHLAGRGHLPAAAVA